MLKRKIRMPFKNFTISGLSVLVTKRVVLKCQCITAQMGLRQTRDSTVIIGNGRQGSVETWKGPSSLVCFIGLQHPRNAFLKVIPKETNSGKKGDISDYANSLRGQNPVPLRQLY